MKRRIITACLTMALMLPLFGEYQIQPNQLMTPWGEKMTPENAWREYPRPQLVRQNWQNLNGLWQYAVNERKADRPDEWAGEILVPFAIETPLSGVKRLLEPSEQLWYRRVFNVAFNATKERVLLHFGGVDFRTQVFVNGVEATDVPHESGNLPFSLDITDFVKQGENELVLQVWDPTDAGVQSPLNPVSPGSWYRTLDDGATGKVGEVAVVGTGALDDLALYDAAGAFEFDTSAGTSTNGVPYAWFNDQGLAWDPAGDIDGDTYAARDEYAAGTDPWDAADFLRILATGFDDGRFVLYFNGAADVSHYSVEEVEDLAQGVWAQAQGYGPIIRANGTNVWTQATQPAGAAPQRFFRVIAAPPAE